MPTRILDCAPRRILCKQELQSDYAPSGKWPGGKATCSTKIDSRHYNDLIVAAGDPQRVWFPEMIDTLRSAWHRDISFEEIVKLTDDLDALLQQIRYERQIRPPVFKSQKCGYVGEREESHLGLGATILSVIRFNIDAVEPTYAIERTWNVHRNQNGLNLYGKSPAPSSGRPGCVHSAVK
jgi:hypothetical protein